MDKKVLVAAPVHPALVDGLEALGYSCVQHPGISNAAAFQIIGTFEGLITSTRLRIDKYFIDQAKALKWVGRMGSGMEIIDTGYATQKGLFYCSSPAGNANAVAEHALGMLLALQHKIVSAHLELRDHIWLREENRGYEIAGKTAGIIGFGHNGSALARKLKHLGLRVLAYDKYQNDFEENGITNCADLSSIYQQADIVSFHVPLTEETTHYFNSTFLDAMERPFVLLNLSRGPVVDTAVLEEGLLNGKITGAALDVWPKEPVEKMDRATKACFDRLMQHPRFLGTPHIGGYTHEALLKMSQILLDKITVFLDAKILTPGRKG